MWRRALCIVGLLASAAHAQPTIQRPLVRVEQAGTFLATRPTLNCSTNVTCTDDVANNRVTITASGGGGGGNVTGAASSTDNEVVRFDGTTGKAIQDATGCVLGDDGVFAGACGWRAVHGVSTCMVLTTSGTFFMGMGTCVDPTEAMVEQPYAQTASLLHLSCITSAAIGSGNSITVTARTGTCGSLANSTLVCTLTGGAGRSTCNSGGTVITVAANECVSYRVVTPGTMSALPAVNCTVEQTL